MGLDMYLEARKSVSGYSHRPIDDQNEYEETLALMGLSKADFSPEASPFGSISVGVAYWRKANQIHAWFINNHAPDGVDDCRPFFVGDKNELLVLRNLCQEVLDDHDKAGELLPPSEGFFFGSYEYDEYYFSDLTNTIEQLDRLITNPKYDDFEFVYHASW